MHRSALVYRQAHAHDRLMVAAEHLARRFNLDGYLDRLSPSQQRDPEVRRLHEREALVDFMEALSGAADRVLDDLGQAMHQLAAGTTQPVEVLVETGMGTVFEAHSPEGRARAGSAAPAPGEPLP